MRDSAYYETPAEAYRQLGLLCTAFGSFVRKTTLCPPRRLECYAAVWISSGSGWLETSATPHRLPIRSGSLFWLFPGIIHTYAPGADGWTEQWVMFEGPQAASFERLGFFSATQPVHVPPNAGAIEAIFAQLAADFSQESHLTSVLGATLISRLVVTAHQQASEEQAESTSLVRALYQCKMLIEEQAFEASNIEEIVCPSPLGYSTLRRHFKNAFGFSPKEYLLSLRLRKAKELLVFTQQSIAEVAQSVGFLDPYYFSRLFHAKEGLTPSLFRAQQRIPTREAESL